MRFLQFIPRVSGLVFSVCCFYMNLSALTIMPADSFYRVQVPYSARYQGIVIEPMPDQDPTMITIVAFKAKNPQDQGVQTGSAALNTLAGQAITCNTASWLPWSSAEYHIHAYRTDPSTSECQESLNAPDVISIRAATAQELKVAHEKAHALKTDIYDPLFLQSKIKKRYIAAGVIAAGVAVCGIREVQSYKKAVAQNDDLQLQQKLQHVRKSIQERVNGIIAGFNAQRIAIRSQIGRDPEKAEAELKKIDEKEKKFFSPFRTPEQSLYISPKQWVFTPVWKAPGKVTIIRTYAKQR